MPRAASRGDLAGVTALLADGASVTAFDNDGLTALMRAAQSGQPDIVRALLAKGAKVNARAKDGDETALIEARGRDM